VLNLLDPGVRQWQGGITIRNERVTTTDQTYPAALLQTVEGQRLRGPEAAAWRSWGPYLSERQWGTVREDYSADGDAWNYFPFEHAHARAYRWGEDGIAGFSDDQQKWCLSLALWNGQDDRLKERLFGLTNEQGNHGEDVKELWSYLDAVPSHAYLKMAYHYPQGRFPYAQLLAENLARRGQKLPEFELTDTGIFAENRYFEVGVEYAKAGPDDILLRVTVTNHGPDSAPLHVLPQLVARNTWSWKQAAEIPALTRQGDGVVGTMPGSPPIRLTPFQPSQFLFCRNETNEQDVFGVGPLGAWKDAINDAIVANKTPPDGMPGSGTKCAAVSQHEIDAGQTIVLRYRLAPDVAAPMDQAGFEAILATRLAEADAFYAALQTDLASADARAVQRQALAGLIWSKQYYHYNVKRWLDGDPDQPPPPPERRKGRNGDWSHLDNAQIVLMPDKWEYPWYASWDLAFHAVTMAMIDPEFAKAQLVLLGREWYMHPSGQWPAYEWSFSDANPPVQAWATLRIYRMDAALTGQPDRMFLERVFHKLMLNFTWWVNRKDANGLNLFQGGFLGLDNIGPFDRSSPLPMDGVIDQADGTAWMAMYALGLMRIALELAKTDAVYEDIASKFFEHFLYIARAISDLGGTTTGLWDETDQFFYDVLQLQDGQQIPLRVRSIVGLIPLCAVEVLDGDLPERFPGFAERTQWMLDNRPDLTSQVSRFSEPGKNDRLLLSLLRKHRMNAVLTRMLDETEFLSDFGLRSLSKAHGTTPYALDWEGKAFTVAYEPGVSESNLFGGNSNWRGPIWLPLNFMLIDALYEFERFYGEDFTMECPTGSRQMMGLTAIAEELSRRLTRIFLKDGTGHRPVYGSDPIYAVPGLGDAVRFSEFFHGDSGVGLGASHQTGWSALVALLLQPRPPSNGTPG